MFRRLLNATCFIVAVTSFLWYGSLNLYADEIIGDSLEGVMVLESHKLKVEIPGDSIWRMARRFGVSVKSILGLNPDVAKRDEPGREQWLYLERDTVIIPLLHSEMRNPEDVPDSATIAISMGKVRENEALITKMRLNLTVTTQALSETNEQLTKTSVKLAEASKKNAVLENQVSELRFDRNLLFWTLLPVLVALVTSIMLFVSSNEKFKDSRNTVLVTTTKLQKLEGDLNDAHHKLNEFRALAAALAKKTTTTTKPVPIRTVVVLGPKGTKSGMAKAA